MDAAAPLDPVTRAMSQAVLAISSERRFESVLRRIVDTSRELVGARYAALGVPDGEDGFAHFVTSGTSEAEIEAIGPLPRLIAGGRGNRQIGEELGIAEKTVKTHVSNLLAKLGEGDRTQAAVRAVQEGIVPPAGG